MEIRDWIANNKLKVTYKSPKLFEIDGNSFLYVEGIKEGKKVILFDELMCLKLSEEESFLFDSNKPKYFVFEFGGTFYFEEAIENYKIKNPQVFRYIGRYEQSGNEYYCNLFVRGGYEILNGVGLYEEYCRKAKWMGHDVLGIAERNTLGGTLAFQFECNKIGIKPIIGETVIVQSFDMKRYNVKLYAMNDQGWISLLQINKIINVDNEFDKYISDTVLLKHTKGLICVVEPNVNFSFAINLKTYKKAFSHLYFALDTSRYLNQKTDLDKLTAIKSYLSNVDHIKTFAPIIMSNTFYADQDYAFIKTLLNQIDGVSELHSNDEYFKTFNEQIERLYDIWPKDQVISGYTRLQFITEASDNLWKLTQAVEFKISTGVLKLPEYDYNHKCQDGVIRSKEDLFSTLLQEGFVQKCENGMIPEDRIDEYAERLEREYNVLVNGKVHHYFLILWDVFVFCKRENIYTGIGRGSAGGCLIAWLLDITRVDPIKYDLIFERFINESRIATGLPDIDSDIESARRPEVKRYIEERFGEMNVCCIGTYTTLKPKAAIKDLGKQFNLSHDELNYINSTLATNDDWNWWDLFKYANNGSNATVKAFVKKNIDLINAIRIVLDQPRSCSVHAAGMIIVPNKTKDGEITDIYKQIPVKRVDGIIVSEWEGEYLDKAGFLKEDILGITQLDKFKEIVTLIKRRSNIDIDIYNLPHNNKEVFELFKKGLNEDVFHFGAKGLKNYCLQVKPSSLNELIAVNAIFRPGPIAANAHNDYVSFKQGLRQPRFDPLTEDITKETYSLIVYQEQVMKICQVVGDFTMIEAEDVRRAMGKKIHTIMDKYKSIFVNRAVDKGYERDQANILWKKLEDFSTYAFNKSHAAAYSITGYICQWLKVNYPVEFWSVSLKFAKKDDINSRLSEMIKVGSNIKITAPDVNISTDSFEYNDKTGKFYFPLNKIAGLGAASFTYLMQERKERGQFYSFEEFLTRCEKKYMKRNVVKNMIFTGCFDEIESIAEPIDRIRLITQHESFTFKKGDEKDPIHVNKAKNKNYLWKTIEKDLLGYGSIDYTELQRDTRMDGSQLCHATTNYVQDKNNVGRRVLLVGVVDEIIERKTKNGPMGILTVDHNGDALNATIWPDKWRLMSTSLTKKCIMFMEGIIKYDEWNKRNVIYSFEGSRVEILN